jgi:1-acyl-sn-glycerol-3-phosphate acyltransferase
MNRQPFQKPPHWWPPKLSPGWIRCWRPLRRRQQLKVQRLVQVDVSGIEHVRSAIAENCGVLITPNHSSHADCYSTYEAADRVGVPFFIMVAWQVFQRGSPLRRLSLQHHGCFSIDREGTDLHAFRQAVEILQSQPNPLVVFPEGEVYHCNERLTPFREGPAGMALLAARKASRPIVCIPCAMKYTYVETPMPQLLQLMDELERAIHWRPRPDLPLARRIYHFAEGALALKEIEYLGHTGSGPLPKRLAELTDFILGRIEARLGLGASAAAVPERVKTLRHHLIQRLESLADAAPDRWQCEEDLDDVFLVVQLFSYPGNYVGQRPSLERMAETLDKFEEDVLGVPTATIRGTRNAKVVFGEPVRVSADRATDAAANLTRILEGQVQALVDQEEPSAERTTS